MDFRVSLDQEVEQILAVHAAAFGGRKGEEIANLVNDLLVDVTALPLLSLVATVDHTIVGHIIFSKAKISNPDQAVSSVILAPLAVHPDFQCRGVGGKLIKHGLMSLLTAGVELVFVLGHPTYYPKHGFCGAGKHGLDAPFPIPDEHADAWMVQELHPGLIGRVKGRVQCSAVLNQPQHWRE
jgi:predicted N-acetyltransferase YhbS